jgi:hypothetical protein
MKKYTIKTALSRMEVLRTSDYVCPFCGVKGIKMRHSVDCPTRKYYQMWDKNGNVVLREFDSVFQAYTLTQNAREIDRKGAI